MNIKGLEWLKSNERENTEGRNETPAQLMLQESHGLLRPDKTHGPTVECKQQAASSGGHRRHWPRQSPVANATGKGQREGQEQASTAAGAPRGITQHVGGLAL